MEKLKLITREELLPTLHTGRDDSPSFGVDGMQALLDAHPDLNSGKINENVRIQDANNAVAQSHIDDAKNPHAVTRLQVGLGNVDDTSDLDKPISTAQQAALDLKADTTAVDVKDSAVLAAAIEYTNLKVVEIGTADMAMAVYDPTGKRTDVFAYADNAKAEANDHTDTEVGKVMVQLNNLATVATHAKSGIMHKLTLSATATEGLQQVAFMATAEYNEGDTWGVNGIAYTAEVAGEDGALPELLFVAGNIVSLTLDPVGKKLGFKGGGAQSKPPSNMLYFNCMPSKDYVRLAWTRPVDADGVMIRRKTSPWVEGDGKTDGDLVLTANYNTNGANNWWEDTGVLTGQRYYYKAIPYRGNTHNTLNGVAANVATCIAGGLWAEWTFDSVAGTMISDTSGAGHNATAINVTYEKGTVGNQANFALGKHATIAGVTDIIRSVSTVFEGIGTLLSFGTIDTRTWFDLIVDENNDVSARYRNANGGAYTGIRVTKPDNRMFLVCNTNGRTSAWTDMDIFLNAVKASTVNIGGDTLSGLASVQGMSHIGRLANRTAGIFTGSADQMRLWTRNLEDYEIANLYNNGKGC